MNRAGVYHAMIFVGGALVAGGCADSIGPDGGGFQVSISSGPATVRQGDIATFSASVTQNGSPATAAVTWSVEPGGAGHLEADGRFVAYAPGSATIVAEIGSERAEHPVTVTARGVPVGTFSVVGQGQVSDRHTSDLWLHDNFAYTGTWGSRAGPTGSLDGNRLNAWDISNPAMPLRTASLPVVASTINDVKIRADGTLAVLSHEGSPDFLNGFTLLDLADPLHPAVIRRFTDTMEQGVHNVWIDGDFVYAVVDGSNSNAGLRIIDVSDPANPAIVASFYGGDPNANFGQFLHDVYVRDGLAFLAHWDAGLIILDVGNGIAGGSPQNPIEVSRVRTAGGDTHNAWYWPESGYVFVGEEDFATPGVMHVIDASDLANPVEVATFGVTGTTPHNFWLDEAEGVLYVGWYEAGVYAIDISGELLGDLDRQGRTIASFLYDGAGGCQTVGTCAWAPQLHQGNVWVSDLNSGLWALRLDF